MPQIDFTKTAILYIALFPKHLDGS